MKIVCEACKVNNEHRLKTGHTGEEGLRRRMIRSWVYHFNTGKD